VTDVINPLLFALWHDLNDVRVLWQAGAIGACLLFALWLSFVVRRKLRRGDSKRHEIGLGGVGRFVFSLSALVLVLTGRWVFAHLHHGVSLFNVAVPLLTAMAVICFAIYMLRLVFAPGRLLATFERTLAWIIWLCFALHVLGLSSDILEFFDDLGFHLGHQRISLLLIGQAVLWSVVALLLALWAGRLAEERLMSAEGMDVTLRVMLAKLMRAVLVVLAVLIALPAVGIDLTALSVFGGALGVGVGFGLQKIASNYISGFIILLDRSVTIGDFIAIEHHAGILSKMTARYVVVRALDGTEAIIPNETVITSTVINHSYTDRRVSMAVPVRISYASDLDCAMRLMLEIARRQSRVLAEPPAAVLIKAFSDNGIDLELGVWMEDPERGKANLRSDIYHDIWREFRANGIDIPYPQREVRLIGSGAPGPA